MIAVHGNDSADHPILIDYHTKGAVMFPDRVSAERVLGECTFKQDQIRNFPLCGSRSCRHEARAKTMADQVDAFLAGGDLVEHTRCQSATYEAGTDLHFIVGE